MERKREKHDGPTAEGRARLNVKPVTAVTSAWCLGYFGMNVKRYSRRAVEDVSVRSVGCLVAGRYSR
jgi:hypothetical protein